MGGKVFEDGVEYWLHSEDGSKLKVTARQDKYGEFGLIHDDFGFLLYVSWDNLMRFELERIK